MRAQVSLIVKQFAGTLFLLCLTSVSSLPGGSADKDSVPSMVSMLPKLSQGQPKPVWQAAIKQQETDFVKFISNDRVLVGTVEAAGMAWGLEPRDIVLLNATDGKTIWTSPRKFGFPQQLLATNPVILLQGYAQCAALNPADGALVWERPCLGTESILLPEDQRIVLYSRKKSTVSLKALNIKDGSDAWSATLENYPEGKDVTIDARTVGRAVLLVGPEIAAISADAGRTLWRKPFPGSFGKAAAGIPVGDDMYFTDGAAITRIDPISGNALWRQEFPGKSVQNLSMSADTVLALLREGGNDGLRDQLQALDRATGKSLWKCDLGGQAQSVITIQEGRIYITAANRLIGVDASNGSPVLEGAIPPNLQAHRLLPDILQITDDRIIIAREIGVMAVRKQDGTLLYAESIAGATPFTSDYAMHKMNRALESTQPLKKREDFHAETLTSYSQARYQATLQYQHAMNRFNLAMARVRAAGQANYGTGNYLPGNPASDWSTFDFMLNQQMAAAAQAQAAANLVYSSLAGYQAALGALMNRLRGERMGIMSTEISQTFQSHANSLQKSFYVRPRYESGRGWSLVLVDLKTGTRADLVLSPDNPPLARSAANLPAFSIDPSGSRIVAKGLGLDPARFETYEKRSFTARRKKIYPHLETWNIPYPSLLSFDLASFPFGQKSESRIPEPQSIAAEKRKLNEQLISAAFECEPEAVKNALDAGADANAVDEYGHTALMLASESLKIYKKKDIIAMLLEHGADATIKDPDGWTAADHFAIMGHFDLGGVQDGLDLILKAQKEAIE